MYNIIPKTIEIIKDNNKKIISKYSKILSSMYMLKSDTNFSIFVKIKLFKKLSYKMLCKYSLFNKFCTVYKF